MKSKTHQDKQSNLKNKMKTYGTWKENPNGTNFESKKS
jgi:hypothetical protein